jgi:NAD(P)-dependent dehydrogenase (short-subunit alcohol dehydrogenase family)
MNKTYLIAGPSVQLIRDIAVELGKAGGRVIVTDEPGKPPLFDTEVETGCEALEWNRRSPLSARTVVVQALNIADQVDEFIHVFVPAGDNPAFHEIGAALVEEKVDQAIKGCFFLVKEMILHFQKRGNGTITFVHWDGGSDVLSPVDAALSGAYKAFVTALFAQYQNEPLRLRGFQSSSAQSSDFAQFIAAAVDVKPDRSQGRWAKHAVRGGLFQFTRKQA